MAGQQKYNQNTDPQSNQYFGPSNDFSQPISDDNFPFQSSQPQPPVETPGSYPFPSSIDPTLTTQFETTVTPTDNFNLNPNNFSSDPTFDTGVPSQSYDSALDSSYSPNYDTNYQAGINNNYSPSVPIPPDEPVANTFEDKKSGNKLFLIGSIILVVVLLIATGILIWINFGNGNNNSNNNSDQTSIVNDSENKQNQEVENNETDESAIIVDTGSTGGSDTPATKSRVNNSTSLSKEWRLQKFTRPDADGDGNCTNDSKCGNEADPDSDGASNIVEFNFGTDPLEADSDRDRIADGDELFIYYTNPNSAKSDTDAFTDNVEIANCFDPITTDTAKISSQRRSQLASNVTLKPLHEPTKAFLKSSGASDSDILNRALVSATCPAQSTTQITPTTTETGAN